MSAVSNWWMLVGVSSVDALSKAIPTNLNV